MVRRLALLLLLIPILYLLHLLLAPSTSSSPLTAPPLPLTALSQLLRGHDIQTKEDLRAFDQLKERLFEMTVKWGGKEDNEVGGFNMELILKEIKYFVDMPPGRPGQPGHPRGLLPPLPRPAIPR